VQHDPRRHIDRAAGQARQAAREAAPWVEKAARAGYAAKGVVYALVGILAVQVALGDGGSTEGSRGALRSLADEPFGQVLLGLIALGLFGYVVWRAVGAFMAPEGEGTGRRVFYAVSGAVYAGLAIWAARLALGGGGGGGEGSGGQGQSMGWTADLMGAPGGRWLVGIAGLALLGYGVQQLYHAYTTQIDERLDLSSMSPTMRQWTIRFGRFGVGARGVVLSMIGGFVLTAAWQADPSEARGLGGALSTLRDQSYGPWLLGLVALGLIAYGIYNLIRARYRVINP